MTKSQVIRDNFKNFFSNNALSAMLDNILAMFPSAILMPILINGAVGYEIFDISLVLFLSGFSTLLFLLYTRGRLPGYLGSSFAFIEVTSYIVASVQSETVTREIVSGYIVGAYLSAGGFLFLLSALCKLHEYLKKRTDGVANSEHSIQLINKIIPPAVLGPAISLIGLELSDQAVVQSCLDMGFNSDSMLALITIFFVIFLSVTRRRIFKKSSILLGVLIAGLIAVILGKWDFSSVVSAPVFRAPSFRFVVPRFSLGIMITVLPPTLILFCEHLARKMTTEGVMRNCLDRKPNERFEPCTLFRTVSGNSFAIMLSGFFGGVPLTLYAENVAVMRINNDVRPNQFYLAGLGVMILSFSGNLVALIRSIPSPIIGGLSLVLMGVIAAPGIKLLVDANVDYSKITNLFLTASVLIVGLSDLSFRFLGTAIEGMSLGLLVGVVMNAMFKLMRLINLSREHIGFKELIARCVERYPDAVHEEADNNSEVRFETDGKFFLRISNDYDEVRIVVRVAEDDDACLLKYKAKKIDDKVAVLVDGTFKDSEIMKFIDASYRITKGIGDVAPLSEDTSFSPHILGDGEKPAALRDKELGFPRVSAHRGMTVSAPENSLPAFEDALAHGADEIEFDLWETADGEIVSCHDTLLERISDGRGLVWSRTLAELKALDFGGGDPRFPALRILTFDEILASLGGRAVLNAHIKYCDGLPYSATDVADKTADLIRKYGLQDSVYVLSDSDEGARRIRERCPEIGLCALAREGEDPVDLARSIGAERITVDKRIFTEELVRKAKDGGLRVNCGVAETAEEAETFLRAGVDTVMTNDCSKIGLVVENFASSPEREGKDGKIKKPARRGKKGSRKVK